MIPNHYAETPRFLNASINLFHYILRGIRFPIPTGLCHHHGYLPLLDLVRAFQDVRRHSHALMPCDVAVERPHSWIVGIDLDYDMPVPSQHLRVTPLWVLWIGDCFPVPGTIAFGEDELMACWCILISASGSMVRGDQVGVVDHVVTVDMHRMDCDVEVVDDEAMVLLLPKL